MMLLQFIIMKMAKFELQAIIMLASINKIKILNPGSVYSCNTSKKILLIFRSARMFWGVKMTADHDGGAYLHCPLEFLVVLF